MAVDCQNPPWLPQAPGWLEVSDWLQVPRHEIQKLMREKRRPQLQAQVLQQAQVLSPSSSRTKIQTPDLMGTQQLGRRLELELKPGN